MRKKPVLLKEKKQQSQTENKKLFKKKMFTFHQVFFSGVTLFFTLFWQLYTNFGVTHLDFICNLFLLK